MKLTKKVFWDLAIYMMVFGVVVGILFVPFTRLLNVPKEYVITILFISSCILAGISVGLANYFITKKIVGSRIKKLSKSMKTAYTHIKNKDYEKNLDSCLTECIILVDSEDEIGESADSFNQLIQAFLDSQKNEKSIRDFTEIFTNELDYKKLAEKSLHHLINYSNANAGMICIDQGGFLDVASFYLIKNAKKVAESDIIKKCFDNCETIDIELDDGIKIDAGIVDFYPKSVLTIPLIYNNLTIGVVLIASVQPFDEEVRRNLIVYCQGLALGMYNALTHERIQKLAVYDPLTKVYNRRFGMQRLGEEFARAMRSDYPFGVLMMDIDKFKSVNDTYGHLVGDLVLVNLCSVVQNCVREGDIVVRYGGEEFMIIVPGASLKTSVEVAEKIRRTVEENVIHHLDQELKITLSIGVSAYPDNRAPNINQLIEYADNNLYKAKESGRNKVIYTKVE